MDNTTVHNANVPEARLPEFAAGHMIAGRYVLGEELGRGAMGVVYRALDQRTRSNVVVKLVRSGDSLSSDRFKRGTRLLLGLSHPGICQAEGCGNGPGYHYLVLRDLPGASLMDALNARLRFPPLFAARLLAEFLESLAYLHACNVVHRDIKPGNLILTGSRGAERLVLIDFDLAKRFGPNVSDSGRFHRDMVVDRLSTAGCLSGTPIYMSPERLRGAAANPEADLYASALVLYQLICGDLPTSGEAHRSVAALLAARTAPVPPPSEWGVTLPPQLETVLLKALSTRQSERYQSAVGFARALRQASQLRTPTPLPFRWQERPQVG